MLIVLTTTPDIAEADALAEKIVASKLAACVQILPQMTSVYVWDGAVQRETEHLLLVKSRKDKYDELEALITANHRYTVPEIVAIDTERVAGPYLDWLNGILE